jgi:hypothetical protein
VECPRDLLVDARGRAFAALRRDLARRSGQLGHQLALGGGRLLEGGAVAAGQQLFLGGAQPLARREQLPQLLPALPR